MGDGAGNPTSNNAMSTSGDSVNQNVPLQPPGEAIGGSLAPQDNVLPGVGTYDGAPSMVNVSAQQSISGVPSGSMEVIGSAQVGGYDPSQSLGHISRPKDRMWMVRVGRQQHLQQWQQQPL